MTTVASPARQRVAGFHRLGSPSSTPVLCLQSEEQAMRPVFTRQRLDQPRQRAVEKEASSPCARRWPPTAAQSGIDSRSALLAPSSIGPEGKSENQSEVIDEITVHNEQGWAQVPSRGL